MRTQLEDLSALTTEDQFTFIKYPDNLKDISFTNVLGKA